MKEAPKPNDKLTDEQWGGYKKDFESQAHEDLGMSAMARKKTDLGISEFKMAVDMGASPSASTMIRLAAAYDTAKMPDEEAGHARQGVCASRLGFGYEGVRGS